MHHPNVRQQQRIGWRLKLGAKWAIVHWTGHLNGKQNSIHNKKVLNSLVSVINVYVNAVEIVQLPFLVARTKDTTDKILRQIVKTLNNAHVQS